jgi:hypothetical protein
VLKKYTLQRKSCMFEAAPSTTLFPSENWFRFWKEYFLQLWCFKVDIGSVCYKLAYSAKLKKHKNLSKENHVCQKQEHLAHCFPVSIEVVFERNTLANHSFQFRLWLMLLWIGLFSWVEETHVPLQRKPSCWKLHHLAHYFPVRTVLIFERNTSWKS